MELSEETVQQESAAFAEEVRGWIADHTEEIEAVRAPGGSTSEQLQRLRHLQRLLYDAGLLRRGWPEKVGGLGGSMLLRGVLIEELVRADCPPPLSFAVMEVYAPPVADLADPELAAEMLPRLLNGSDIWCQGFSEPDAGSDLGSLRTRAVFDGENWIVNGQKVWTSFADEADRCILLVRTGTQEEGARGITAMFVDMDTPGIEVQAIKAPNGDDEFAEVFLSDVAVPQSRVIGEVGQGWGVTMAVLVRERGAFAWQRQAWLHRRLEDLVKRIAEDPAARARAAGRLGEAYQLLYSLRLRSRKSFRDLAAGREIGPESSVDKVTLAATEQAVYDIARDLLPELLLLEDDANADQWRSEYWYSRAATIYGGSSEIQRDIISQRVLGLPRSK